MIKKQFCLLISTECITHAFKIADCGPLFDPDIYTHVSTPNGTIYNKIASYSCVTGYKLNGNATRKCSASGYWNGGEPSCTVIGRCITFTFVFIPAQLNCLIIVQLKSGKNVLYFLRVVQLHSYLFLQKGHNLKVIVCVEYLPCYITFRQIYPQTKSQKNCSRKQSPVCSYFNYVSIVSNIYVYLNYRATI